MQHAIACPSRSPLTASGCILPFGHGWYHVHSDESTGLTLWSRAAADPGSPTRCLGIEQVFGTQCHLHTGHGGPHEIRSIGPDGVAYAQQWMASEWFTAVPGDWTQRAGIPIVVEESP